MERTQPQPDRPAGQFAQQRPMTSSLKSGKSDPAEAHKQPAKSASSRKDGLPRVGRTDLPPMAPPVGLDRRLHWVFGRPPLQLLRVVWPVARVFWLGLGLVVIGAAVLDYLVKLFTGGLPNITEAFFSSPVLEIPSRHPLRFMAVAAVVLVLTVATWGAAREQRRLINARAAQVYRALRAGVKLEQLDEETYAWLVAGEFSATFFLATQLHEQNRPDEAARLYQLIHKQAPKHFGAAYNLGLIYAESEQCEAAEDYCRTAILLNPDSAEAQGLLAYVLYRLGYLEEAQRRARLAVRMGFSSKMLEMLILPGLGVTTSLPSVRPGESLS